MKRHRGRTYVAAAIIAALALTLFTIPHMLPYERLDRFDLGTLTARVGSGSGEWINVRLDLEGALTWTGHSYSVNGTGDYSYVELICIIHVEFTNVENVVIDYIKIKAVDDIDGSYHVYTLASNVAVSSSPYDSTFSTGMMSIDAHLDDVQADTDANGPYRVKYYITVQVSGTGTITGEALTATISYRWFNTYEYAQQGGSSGYDPIGGGGSVATWVPTPTAASLIGLTVLACLALWWAKRVVRVKNGRRRKGRRGARA